MGKLATAKKVISKVSNVATKPIETATNGQNNNLLLLSLIIFLWMILFFKGNKTKDNTVKEV